MISDAEKQERREAVAYAKYTLELDDVYLSKGLLAILDRFVEGELTLEEFGKEYDEALEKGI